MIENRILPGDNIDTLRTLPDKSVDMCVTSPPYYMLRDYGDKRQIGLEETPIAYIRKLVAVFAEVRRVLKNEGTLWVNIADTYNGSQRNNGAKCVNKKMYKQHTNTSSQGIGVVNLKGYKRKTLLGIPYMFALAMIQDGWILRQDIIWSKPSCMPESVKDRFCKSHEYLFLFAKQPNYYFNYKHSLEKATGYDGRHELTAPIGFKEIETHGEKERRRERWPQRGYTVKPNETGLTEQYHGASIETTPLRIKRDVWTIASEPSGVAHYAMYPQKLITPCILCGCPENGIVLDPFMGSGTTAVVALKLLRRYIGCELNPKYIKIAERLIARETGLFKDYDTACGFGAETPAGADKGARQFDSADGRGAVVDAVK